MKTLLLWLALVAAIGTAAAFAVFRSQPAASALKQFVSPGPLSSPHANLADRCASCHESYAGVTAAKCTVCHANAERLLGRQPTAFHASVGECAACHVEHQGANIRPIPMDHVELARIATRTLTRSASTDAASATTLKSMETWLRIREIGRASCRERV